MTLRTRILAGAVGLPLLVGTALAADAGSASLVDAAKQGDRVAVRSMLDRGAGVNVNAPASDGSTALFWAVSRNDAEMVDLLLKAGANVNVANDYGATALYVASTNADEAIVAKLLDAKANPNAALSSGETPLMQAARRGKVEVVRTLLARGANPNAKESNGGQTALMWAISERHSAVTDELVKRGADVHARSNGGSTALMFAAQQGDAESARILLAAGARANDRIERNGQTPLIIASAMGHEAVAVQLLEAGADPDAVDRIGFSSLHRAVRDKNAVGIVKALLKHDADPNLRLNQARTASATEYGSPLGRALAPIAVTDTGMALQGATPLLLAAEINNYDAVVALVEARRRSVDPDRAEDDAAHLRCGRGHRSCASAPGGGARDGGEDRRVSGREGRRCERRGSVRLDRRCTRPPIKAWTMSSRISPARARSSMPWTGSVRRRSASPMPSSPKASARPTTRCRAYLPETDRRPAAETGRYAARKVGRQRHDAAGEAVRG